MNQVTQTDWSGGLSEQKYAGSFAVNKDKQPTQAARLKGFVLENEVTARSQWECQRFTVLPGSRVAKDVYLLLADGTDFIVVIATDGTIWYTSEPSISATNTTTNAVTWTQVSTSSPSASYRFLCEFPKKTTTAGYRNTLRVHALSGSSPAVDIYFNGTGLSSEEISDYYPTATSATEFGTGKAPRANGATLWGDFMCLFDIDWLKSPPDANTLASAVTLNSGTVTHHSNGFWVTQAVDKTKVSPIDVVFVGTSNATIVNLVTIDSGLLVFTSDAGNNSGVFLLRGTADNPKLEPVRMGLGTAPPPPTFPLSTSLVGHRGPATKWPATGSVIWLDRQGRVWNTDGQDTVQLDRNGPAPATAPSGYDHAAAAGRHLFIARDNRLLVFTGFDSDGAWSELVRPANSLVRSMHGAEHALYFVCDGKVWRYLIGNDGGQRGKVNGTLVDLTFGSATFAPNGSHETSYWHEVGLNTGGTGTVKTLSVHDGSYLAADNNHTVTTTVNANAAAREPVVVRAHGPSNEASMSAVVQGDVWLEALTFWHQGGRNVR